MGAGVRKWTAIIVEKKVHVAWACRNKRGKDMGPNTANKRDMAKFKKGKTCSHCSVL